MQRLRLGVLHGAVLIFAATLAVNLLVYLGLDGILWFLRVPEDVLPGMRAYLLVIFGGILATSIYNFCACLLRAVGNSVVPLVFLAVSAVGNIVLDLLFVAVLLWGITGAAAATVISQYASGIGIAIYVAKKAPELLPKRGEMKLQKAVFREIGSLSALTCLQQSVMNFGILMVQGLVNSFGTVIMAAFAAAVKIDTFAYLPVQDFGQCLFYVCGPELWGRAAGTDLQGNPDGAGADDYILGDNFRAGVPVCGATDGDFRENRRGCGDCRRSDLSPHGRGLLFWYRRSVPALWLLPGH